MNNTSNGYPTIKVSMENLTRQGEIFNILEIQKIQEKKYERFYVIDVDLDKSSSTDIHLVFSPYNCVVDESFVKMATERLDFNRYVGHLFDVVNIAKIIQFECIPMFNNRDLGVQLSRQVIDVLEKKLNKYEENVKLCS